MSEDYQDSLVFILEHMLNMVQEILQDKFHVYKKFLQRLELQMMKRGCHFLRELNGWIQELKGNFSKGISLWLVFDS